MLSVPGTINTVASTMKVYAALLVCAIRVKGRGKGMCRVMVRGRGRDRAVQPS